MKKDIHPKYRQVLYIDTTNGAQFLIPGTVPTKDKAVAEADGQEYDLVKVSISSSSHRHWTKRNEFLDTEGRLDKFVKKFQRKAEQQKVENAKQDEANKAKAVAKKKK